MRTTLLLAVALAMSSPFAVRAGGEAHGARTYGAPLPDVPAVAISAALADFDAHAGTPRRFAGRIVGVCQNKGCWAMLEDDGKVARVMFPKHDVVLPKDASGRAEVHGVLERRRLSTRQVEHFRAEDTTGLPVSDVEYRIVADGLEIAG